MEIISSIENNFCSDYKNQSLFSTQEKKLEKTFLENSGEKIPVLIGEFWTAKQRQSNSIHEISYRACFKAQLPKFFIELLSKKNDIVYDPFAGRGTSLIEASLLGRKIIGNDVNPLSEILTLSRLFLPTYLQVKKRLNNIDLSKNIENEEFDLHMFFHKDTEKEIRNLRNYFKNKKIKDSIDLWIQMVATNRLTGHSNGFFSVYTMPPNQAVSAKRQMKINEKREQVPDYRNIKELILKKTKSLARNSIELNKNSLISFFTNDARRTPKIKSNSVQLTVTSPPFLDVVNYADDNWLRLWFNNFSYEKMKKRITMLKKLEDWEEFTYDVMRELFRITKEKGFVAYEVGEVKNGKIKLEEAVVRSGKKAGFTAKCILINKQNFTKTASCWGVSNNEKGTNTNRIVVFQKEKNNE